MNTGWLRFLVLSAAFTYATASLHAAPFELLWKAGSGAGESSVKVPDSTGADKVESGRAYPYGSTITTPAGASLPIELGPGNEVTLGGNGNLRTAVDPKDSKKKLLTLDSGKLDVVLLPEYAAENTLDVAGTCLRTSFTKGGKASFETAEEVELKVFVVTCGDANLAVVGPQFTIATLDKDDVLSAACSPDMTYLRLKNVKGAFEANIRNEAGESEPIAMEPGAVIKIHQKRSEIENTVMVTILICGADDSVKRAITYNVPTGEMPPSETAVAAATEVKKPAKQKKAPKTVEAPKEEAKEQPKETEVAKTEGGDAEQPKEASAKRDWKPIWASTTTTSTTSTTTMSRRDRMDLANWYAWRATALSGSDISRVTTTTHPPTPVGKR